MHLTTGCFTVADPQRIRPKMLNWLKPFNIFCFLDSCGYRTAHSRWDLIAGAGRQALFTGPQLKGLDSFLAPGRTAFGHMCFELGGAPHPEGFPPVHFFEPAITLRLRGTQLWITAPDPESVWKELEAAAPLAPAGVAARLLPVLDREEYIRRINRLKEHILRGDCYEINFCQFHTAEGVSADPEALYLQLVQESPNPFSALYHLEGQYLICASPERFLQRDGGVLRSQPIKGTAPRGADAAGDEASRLVLQESAKERAENIMVTDLVRNDLSRVCAPGSVEVEELCGIHPFPQVFQMISTVRGRQEVAGLEAVLEALFPMGSMTGAPKRRVLELIRQYEAGARGIFSGTLGYVEGDGNFDFNVVIRSLIYDRPAARLSVGVGSGITAYCSAEAEWEECRWKVAAIKKVLGSSPAPEEDTLSEG